MNCLITVDSLALFHRHDVQRVTAQVRINSREIVEVEGSAKKFFDLSVPVITLLTEDSTPQKFKLDAMADTYFSRAIEKLITDGTAFFTILRPSWNNSAFLWHRV